MHHRKIGVIGGSQGIGKWLVRFFKDEGFVVHYSDELGRGDFLTNIQLVVSVDIVVLAVPISVMPSVLEEIYPYLHDRTLVDVCSVKTGIINKFQSMKEAYEQINCEYISLHPMFGPGVTSVRGQVVLFNYMHQVSTETLDCWKVLFTKYSALVYDIDYQEHDKIMGIIQGLNHFNVFVSAKTLATMGGDLGLIEKLSSPTYRIFIIFFARYVMQNPRLYAEIQIYNPYVRRVVECFMEEANTLLKVIEGKDIAAFEEYVMDIRPFFAGYHEDLQLSNALIGFLGDRLSKKNILDV